MISKSQKHLQFCCIDASKGFKYYSSDYVFWKPIFTQINARRVHVKVRGSWVIYVNASSACILMNVPSQSRGTIPVHHLIWHNQLFRVMIHHFNMVCYRCRRLNIGKSFAWSAYIITLQNDENTTMCSTTKIRCLHYNLHTVLHDDHVGLLH